ncbi:IBR finger domain protein [Cercospora zeina]
MDPLTLQAIVQMQLEDGGEVAANAKGKQREGTVSDAQVAMQMYMEDLKTCDTFLKDRAMAQSAAMAILQDGNLIAEAYRQEQQAARDREMALRLDARQQGNGSTAAGPAPKQRARQNKRQKKDHKDPWEDPEMLEKVAAIYMQAPEKAATSVAAVEHDSDATVAESSAWAASRKTNSKRPLRACIACAEEKDFFEVVRVPCGHEYCRACLENLFSMSMKDESLFPPRCDRQEIPLDWVRLFVSSKLAKAFEAKYDEMSTKNRTYCHEPTCATFIPQESTEGDVATCPRCTKTTCSICKNPSHSGDCPEDEALNQLISVAEANANLWSSSHKAVTT